MPDHALLSASSSYRWIACPPSARLCDRLPGQSSQYAAEGTDAHTLCQHKVEKALGRETKDPTDNLSYYDHEMENCAEEYAAFVMEQVADAKKHCKDPLVLIEQRLDFSDWVPEGFGTGDCVIVADGILQVIDFKYGVGVLVDAEKNPQMMCYALGAYSEFGFLYNVKTVKMTIFQPRRNSISTYEAGIDELLGWAADVLKPAAELAYRGEGDFAAGDHCRFCSAKAVCRKRAEYNMELAKYDFKEPACLDDTEIAAILPRADELAAWVGDVKEHALRQALSGTVYPGFKVVEGRSVRKYVNDDAAAAAAEKAGYDPYERKILGITAMTKLMGRKNFEEILGSLITKPAGKPVLVPESDKRPALNSACEDFKNV